MNKKQVYSAKVCLWCGIGILLCTLIALYMDGGKEANKATDDQLSQAGAVLSSPLSSAAPAFYTVEMNVSAYCKNSCCCGKWADGFTASGVRAEGLICAADPKYPFGTKMIVAGVTYTVEDRGGAIKGNKLDLLFETHWEALEWGRRTLKVKILK